MLAGTPPKNPFSVDLDSIARLREQPIDWQFKAFPSSEGLTASSLGARGWNVLSGDMLLPSLVLKATALDHNVRTMASLCTRHGVSLAPHAKTAMAPALAAKQLEHGAWGVTAATISQVRVLRAFGFSRVILANQVVERSALRWLSTELRTDLDLDLYCLVDSVAGVELMTNALQECRATRCLPVLVEFGYANGRAGCRTLEEGLAVARAAASSPVLELAGVEGFEGLIRGETMAESLKRVDLFLDDLEELLTLMMREGLAASRAEILLSVGGSAFFDRVLERRWPSTCPPRRVVLRSGCYLTHDSGLYECLSPLGSRIGSESLIPALEIWSAVLSRPRPELAILGMGKRDVSHDAGLPKPVVALNAGRLQPVPGTMTITSLNDQHAYLRLPNDDPLAIGDFVGCGISHPCTTFDKWRLIPVVDDSYTIIDAVHVFL